MSTRWQPTTQQLDSQQAAAMKLNSFCHYVNVAAEGVLHNMTKTRVRLLVLDLYTGKESNNWMVSSDICVNMETWKFHGHGSWEFHGHGT